MVCAVSLCFAFVRYRILIYCVHKLIRLVQRFVAVTKKIHYVVLSLISDNYVNIEFVQTRRMTIALLNGNRFRFQ